MPTPEQIKAARAQAGLTQAQSAELLGVTRNTWARYEIGVRALSDKSWLFWQHAAGLKRYPFEDIKAHK